MLNDENHNSASVNESTAARGRMVCGKCGEIAEVHRNSVGFAVRVMRDGNVCCETRRCKTEEEALARWDKFWTTEAYD